MQDTECGELVCAVPRDDAPVRAHAVLSAINIIRRIRSLRFENTLVRQCRAFNKDRIQRRAKDVCLGTLRDS